jgi:hypothetical protein
MARIFSTVFPVSPKKALDDLIHVVATWVSGSPHRKIATTDLSDLGTNGFSLRAGSVQVHSARLQEQSTSSWGVRLIEECPDGLRTTEIIGHRNGAFHVSVIHDFEALQIGQGIAVKKPLIVGNILAALGGAFDGSTLKVQGLPFEVRQEELEFVAEIINNKSSNRLPIVYLSRNGRENLLGIPKRVATQLGGLAHVLVEPHRRFAFDLRRLTAGRNTYGGAVGVYFPNGVRNVRFTASAAGIEYDLYEVLREYSLYAPVPRHLTFDGILSTQTKQAIEELKSNNATSDELLTQSAETQAQQEKRIKELETANWSLQQKLAQLTAAQKVTAGELLKCPSLAELYQDETRDFVIEALTRSLPSMTEEGRRVDVIKAVLEENPVTGERERIEDKLGNIFHGSNKLTATMESEIRDLGFEIEDGSKHPKVYVPGHESRKYTISKTPSDHRTRKNEFSGLRKQLL